jgi:transposase
MTIPDEIRARIVGMSEGEMSGARIARIIGESSRIVQRIIKQFREHETYQANSSTGRPKKLSERGVRQILLFSKTHRRSSLQDITNFCPVDVSTRTVRRVLHDHNIFSRIAVKKPFLKPLHISRRLHFARQYCGWSAEEWERVCSTNELVLKLAKIQDKFMFGERHMSDIHQVV